MIAGNEGIEVTGVGSQALPYRISNLYGDPFTRLDVIDTDTLNLTLNGTPGDPNAVFTVQGDVTARLRDLSDVSHTDDPAAGDVPTWDGTQWVFSPPAAAAAVVTAGGIQGNGSAGSPVSAKVAAIWGQGRFTDAIFGASSNGQSLYVDPIDGTLRSTPIITATHVPADLPSTYPTALSSTVADTASGWPAAGLLITNCRQSNANATQILIDSAGGLRTRYGTPSGWTAWVQGSGVAAEKPATDLPDTWPLGTTTAPVTAAGTGATWPATAGTVVTSRSQAGVSGQWFYIQGSTGGTRAWYRNSASNVWSPWLQIADSSTGVWVDCSAETRFCTDVSTTANAGQNSSGKYFKIGKMVTFIYSGTVGSGAVANFAMLLPPSAGVHVPGSTSYGLPVGVVGSGGTAVTGGQRIISGDRIVSVEPGAGFSDSGAGWSVRGSMTYEVA